MKNEGMVMFVGSLLMFAALVGLVVWLGDTRCTNQWKRSGFEYSYAMVQGCMIKVDGRWIPASNYRVQ